MPKVEWLESQIIKNKNKKIGASKPRCLNRIAKIGYG
jgi:hypothetical protein